MVENENFLQAHFLAHVNSNFFIFVFADKTLSHGSAKKFETIFAGANHTKGIIYCYCGQNFRACGSQKNVL